MGINRDYYQKRISEAFHTHPIIAVLGPRQCGKTTLARTYAKGKIHGHQEVHFFDLEDPTDLAKLADAKLFLDTLSGLIVIDEIQRIPDLFPYLRVLVDRPNNKVQLLVLGSASRDLIRQSSESLAGRIAYIELTPFCFDEVSDLESLWIRGGFPRSFLAENLAQSIDWRKHYVSTFLERDLPNLGINIPSTTLRRFWTMLAHYHGNIFNGDEIARSMSITGTTARKYLDILSGAFMIRQLQPWFINIKKRQVKSPKIYFRDTGLLHYLLNITDLDNLKSNPKLGASWEGLALEEIIRHYHATPEECYFWATHAGAELDLLIIKDGKNMGFEFKHTQAPKLTKSMGTALENLELDCLTVIYPGNDCFPLSRKIIACGLVTYLSGQS